MTPRANSILDFSQVSLSCPIPCPWSYTTVIFQNPPVLKLWKIMLVSNLSQGLEKRNSAHSDTEFTWRYDRLLSFPGKTQQKLGRELAQTISSQGKCPTRKQHSQNRMIWGAYLLRCYLYKGVAKATKRGSVIATELKDQGEGAVTGYMCILHILAYIIYVHTIFILYKYVVIIFISIL